MSKLIQGVGINDADYVVTINVEGDYLLGKRNQKRVWTCPFYRVWVNMLLRGYNAKYKAKYPTYKEASVCKEWHLFSTFRAWMQQQDWEGRQLDKDLLVRGNKVYSPGTCCFLSGKVNSFLIEGTAREGQGRLIGTQWEKRGNKFVARCKNPFTLKAEYLGTFSSERDAHQVWLDYKLKLARLLAENESDERVALAIVNRYLNYNE